jgi:hypothetical protein
MISNAKDKLTPTPAVRAENDFSMELVSKREKLTQRTTLYKNYNSTQVILLSQIIEKTAKRMDARQTTLNWQYTDDPNGDKEIYVLSPMEQYRASIRMLRKDIAELKRSEAFLGGSGKIEYEHLIAAAFETGVIGGGELDQVLQFEEFWAPKQVRWKTWANFALSLGGTSTYYLPPPWNVIGAIGLVLTQTRLVNSDQTPDPEDNENVIM